MNNLIENNDQEENADANDTNNETNDSVTQTERPTVKSVENLNNSSVANETEVNTTEAQTDLVKTVESTTEAIKEIPVAMEVASTAESLIIDLTTTKAPKTSMQPAETMKDETVKIVSNEIKPTAEALQQNASPVVTTENSMEQTTGPATLMTTIKNGNETPSPTKSKNNSVIASLSTFILICSLAFNFSS